MTGSASAKRPVGRPTGTQVYGCFIGNHSMVPKGTRCSLLDPATGLPWAEAIASPESALHAVEVASNSVREGTWRKLDQTLRSNTLRRLADLVETRREDFARYEILATGKTIQTTQGEAASVGKWLRFFAGAAEAATGRAIELNPSADAVIKQEPVGVVAAITPFNGALSLGSWKLAPALATGNSIVLKPPIEAPASSLLLAELAAECGLPPGVLNVVPGGADVGTALVTDPRVAMVSFTGSTAAAATIGAEAGHQLKRFVCEAGGKSAQIVFPDADLAKAIPGAVRGVFGNAGQTCVAGSRLLVHSSIYADFVHALVERAEALTIGDPFEYGTELGPLATAKQHAKVIAMVDRALSSGARPLTGASQPELDEALQNGFFYRPTVLTISDLHAEIWQEEVFGPVAVVHPFDTEAEAIELANDSKYGLAAGLWTRDINRAHRVGNALEAGTVWVNTYRSFDRRVPFGGYKGSGIGRENSAEALRSFVNTKTIITAYDDAP